MNSANVVSWTALLRAGFHLVARADLHPDNPIDGTAHEILSLGPAMVTADDVRAFASTLPRA